MAGSMFASRISLVVRWLPATFNSTFPAYPEYDRTANVDNISYSVIQKASIGTRSGVYRDFVNKGQITLKPEGPADAGPRSATGNRATGVILIDCQRCNANKKVSNLK